MTPSLKLSALKMRRGEAFFNNKEVIVEVSPIGVKIVCGELEYKKRTM